MFQKFFMFKANGNLAYMLSMNPGGQLKTWWPEAPNPADIHADFYMMYTDIIENQRVDDSFVLLLRCVYIMGENNKFVTLLFLLFFLQ